MKKYLLDTNRVSFLIKGNSLVAARMTAVPIFSRGIGVLRKIMVLYAQVWSGKVRFLRRWIC